MQNGDNSNKNYQKTQQSLPHLPSVAIGLVFALVCITLAFLHGRRWVMDVNYSFQVHT